MKIYGCTGHRPDKLGGYGAAVYDQLLNLATAFLTDDQPDKVISGMALGWDQAWCEAALELGIPVIATLPHEGQQSRWPPKSRMKYRQMLWRCSEIVTVTAGPYEAWKMQRRNEYVVDRSTLLVALWNGSDGGTANCMQYALTYHVPYVNLWHAFQKDLQTASDTQALKVP